MHLLNFTLSAEAVVRIHDIVLCLSKFSEVVSLEGVADKVGPFPHFVNMEYVTDDVRRQYQLVLSALNSSHSAFASFTLDRDHFFRRYNLDCEQARSQQPRPDADAHFTCQIYNKVCLSVYFACHAL